MAYLAHFYAQLSKVRAMVRMAWRVAKGRYVNTPTDMVTETCTHFDQQLQNETLCNTSGIRYLPRIRT